MDLTKFFVAFAFAVVLFGAAGFMAFGAQEARTSWNRSRKVSELLLALGFFSGAAVLAVVAAIVFMLGAWVAGMPVTHGLPAV